ncbi:MAG: GNAT family N-acetyltransferase [Bacteroidia bacterium]
MKTEAFNFNTDYQLENEFALLRPLLSSDFEKLIGFSLNEPELWKYYSVRPSDKDFFKNYISSALIAREEKREYPFIVFDKRKNKYAGMTRFCDIQPLHKRLQIGFTWYGKQFQGTGLNKGCKYLLLQFVFENLQFERVEFRADATNERSITAMKSIGASVDGILRSMSDRLDGTRRDAIVLSILKDEWVSNVKESLINKLSRLR